MTGLLPEKLTRALHTPLGDLLRGRLSAGDYEAVIEATAFEPQLTEALKSSVRRAATTPHRRLRCVQRLVARCREQLDAGAEAAALADRLSNAHDRPWAMSWPDYLERQLVSDLAPESLELLDTVTEKIRSRRLHAAVQHRLAEQWSGKSVDELHSHPLDPTVIASVLEQTECFEMEWLYELPAELSQIVLRVIRRTRLWPSEKRRVADELADHFLNGIEAGQTTEQLRDEFGQPDVAARLIRRAKLRCRPLAWQLYRRSVLTLAAACLCVPVIWSVLWVRMFTGTPAVKVNYVAEFDERSRLTTREQRAWPLYRSGLENLQNPEAQTTDEFIDVLSKGSASAHWPAAASFLESNRGQLDIYLAATRRSTLGFQFNDPENESWRRRDLPADAELPPLYDSSDPIYACLLPHAQELRQVANLLSFALIEAAAAEQGARTAEILVGLFHLAGHVAETSDFAVSKIVGQAIYRQAGDQLAQILQHQPELLDAQALIQLTESMPATFEKVTIDFASEGAFATDLIQRAYTDGGTGGGRVTSEGLQILRKIRALQGGPDLAEILPPLSSDSPTRDQMQFHLVAPWVATAMGTREEVRVKAEELHELFLKDFRRPLWEEGPSEFQAAYDSLAEDTHQRIKFLPILIPMAAFRGFFGEQREEWAAFQTLKNGWLTALAAERYRREHGQWPTALSDLSPEIQSELTLDHFSGQALGYRLNNKEPLIYSAGRDGVDGGGQDLHGGILHVLSLEELPSDGDWQLYPAPRQSQPEPPAKRRAE